MIKIIKLTNGTEIVGKIIEENNDIVVVEDPLQINYKYFMHAYPAVTLTKYILFSGNRAVSFKQSMVLNSVPPRSTFKDYYIAQADKSILELDQIVDAELGMLSQSETPVEESPLEQMPTPKFVN